MPATSANRGRRPSNVSCTRNDVSVRRHGQANRPHDLLDQGCGPSTALHTADECHVDQPQRATVADYYQPLLAGSQQLLKDQLLDSAAGLDHCRVWVHYLADVHSPGQCSAVAARAAWRLPIG